MLTFFFYLFVSSFPSVGRRQNCTVTFQRCCKVIKTVKHQLWAAPNFWSALMLLPLSSLRKVCLHAQPRVFQKCLLSVNCYHAAMLAESWDEDSLLCLMFCWPLGNAEFWKLCHLCAKSSMTFLFWPSCQLIQWWLINYSM